MSPGLYFSFDQYPLNDVEPHSGIDQEASLERRLNPVAISRSKALEHAYEVLEQPRAHMRITLTQTLSGLSVYYDGKVMTRVFVNRSGLAAAAAMGEALRVRLPKLGESVDARVSSGVVYRILALSDLDYRNEFSFQLASRLIAEAKDMQGTRGTSEA